jgi:hypothetical protein
MQVPLQFYSFCAVLFPWTFIVFETYYWRLFIVAVLNFILTTAFSFAFPCALLLAHTHRHTHTHARKIRPEKDTPVPATRTTTNHIPFTDEQASFSLSRFFVSKRRFG